MKAPYPPSEMTKEVAKWKCIECGLLFITPKNKVIHDGVISRHFGICPHCKSINIKYIALTDEENNLQQFMKHYSGG